MTQVSTDRLSSAPVERPKASWRKPSAAALGQRTLSMYDPSESFQGSHSPDLSLKLDLESSTYAWLSR